MPETGLYDAMSTLRAVRRLRPDPVADDVLHRVLEAATWAPTGGNVQPWRVVVVKDPTPKRRLGELYAERWRRYAAGRRRALEGLAEATREKIGRTLDAGDHLAEHFGEAPVIAVFCFDPSNMAITDSEQDRVSVVGGASIYPAVENFLLACRAEGLGCTLTTLLCQCEPEVRAVLAIPPEWGTACAIPIGHPLRGGHGPISRRPVEKLAYLDTWGSAYPVAPSPPKR